MTEWVLSAYRGLTEDICLVTPGGVIAALMLVVVFFHPIEKDMAAMRAEKG